MTEYFWPLNICLAIALLITAVLYIVDVARYRVKFDSFYVAVAYVVIMVYCLPVLVLAALKCWG